MNGTVVGILSTMALTIYILIKEVVIPKRNSRKANPIDLSAFYREFGEFKKLQREWNEKIEKKLGIWKSD